MTLDLSSLKNAIYQVDLALEYCDSEIARSALDAYKLFRMAAIKAFDYTYELSWKMLKRYLELSGASRDTIEQMAFPDLIRTGNEQDLLLSAWDTWAVFRKARNITSHTDDVEKANEVLAVIAPFR